MRKVARAVFTKEKRSIGVGFDRLADHPCLPTVGGAEKTGKELIERNLHDVDLDADVGEIGLDQLEHLEAFGGASRDEDLEGQASPAFGPDAIGLHVPARLVEKCCGPRGIVDERRVALLDVGREIVGH